MAAALRAFAAIAGPETSLALLRDATRPALDLSVRGHREALLRFLRAWGCRHLRRDDTARSSRALASWWSRFGPTLPPETVPLTDLEDAQLAALGRAYAALARSPAAFRASRGGDVPVSFGDTAAAKALFAIRPLAVPPWDEPMRRAFGWGRVDAVEYATFLAAVRDALHPSRRALAGRAVRASRRARPTAELSGEDRRRVPLGLDHPQPPGVTPPDLRRLAPPSHPALSTYEGGTMFKALLVAFGIFLIATFPATWLLMLFLGNVGLGLSYWGALPLGVIVSLVLAGSSARGSYQ